MLDAALDRWPFCTGRLIRTPFIGVGVRTPDPNREADDDEGYERLLEQTYAVERELTGFSRTFPDIWFVFVDAHCFGGTCIYSGFNAIHGDAVSSEPCGTAGFSPLQRLLEPLGVTLADGHFAPFVRGYWGE